MDGRSRPTGWQAVPQAALLLAAVLVAVATATRPLVALVFGVAVLVVVALVVVPPDRAAALGALVLTLIVVLLPVGPSANLLRLGRLNGSTVVAAAAGGLVTLVVLRVKPAVPPPAVLLSGLIFAAFLVVPTVVNGGNLRALLDQWVIWACAFVLGLTLRAGERTLLAGWVVVGLGVAVYAIGEYVFRAQTLYADVLLPGYRSSTAIAPGVAELRSQATFGHPVPLGAFLAVAFCLLAWGPLRPAPFWLFRPLALAALAFAIVTTFARSSWVGLAIAVGVGVLLQRLTDRRRVRPGILAAVVVLALVLSPLGDTVARYVDRSSTTTGYQVRVANLQAVGDVASSGYVPMLAGRGGAATAEVIGRGEDGRPVESFDNQYITLLVESGLLGIAAFLALIWLVAGQALKQLRRPSDATPVDEVQCLLVTLAALAVVMFFFELLYWPSTAFIFWCVLGQLARPAQPVAAPQPSAASLAARP